MQKSIIFSLFMLFSFFVHAQDHASITFGMNYGNVHILPEIENSIIEPGWTADYRPGIMAGLNIEEQLGDGWRLGLMLQYSQKGYDMVINNSADVNSFRYDLADGLLLLERKLIGPLAIFLGGNYSYLIRSNIKQGDTGFIKIENDIISNKHLYGGLAGVKLYFGNVALHGHWNRNFSPVNEYQVTGVMGEDNGSIKEYLQAFQFGLTLYL